MTATETTTTTIPFLDVRALNASIGEQLWLAVSEVAEQCDFIGGSAITAFETEWARYCEVKHAIGVANGTDALELALQALGIGAGDEVIVPTNTFIATAEAVSRTGAVPVFVDVDPCTLLITADGIRAAITSRTAAVAVVHLYGQIPDMDAIGRVASDYGIALVEDAAQAHGATWLGRKAGSFGAVGCFSFYPGKNLGAWGDAGAVVTNDDAIASRVRMAANHGATEARSTCTPGSGATVGSTLCKRPCSRRSLRFLTRGTSRGAHWSRTTGACSRGPACSSWLRQPARAASIT